MSEIKVILWDVDGTLMNFEEAEKSAMQSCFYKFGFGECTEALLKDYSQINRSYWKRLECGEITKPQVLVERFREFFAKHGFDARTAEAFNAEYQVRLGDTVCFYEGAYETVLKLRGTVKQYVVTNGTKIAQERKLKNSGLGPLFDGIFISEELGVEKPMTGFFDKVFAAAGINRREEIMIVGDSLTSDIQGGNNAGIITCWFNRNQEAAPAGLRIDHMIHEIKQVLSLV